MSEESDTEPAPGQQEEALEPAEVTAEPAEESDAEPATGQQ